MVNECSRRKSGKHCVAHVCIWQDAQLIGGGHLACRNCIRGIWMLISLARVISHVWLIFSRAVNSGWIGKHARFEHLGTYAIMRCQMSACGRWIGVYFSMTISFRRLVSLRFFFASLAESFWSKRYSKALNDGNGTAASCRQTCYRTRKFGVCF